MARLSTTQWSWISGDVSSFAYRPLFSIGDVVYKKSEYTMAASAKHQKFQHRPYKVLTIGVKQNTSSVPLKQDGTAITGAVTAQADAPWKYDVQEILSGETQATASGPVTRDINENDLNSLADIKTYIGTEKDDWADPAAS